MRGVQDISDIVDIWKGIFKEWKYSFIAIFSSIAFYLLTVLIFQFKYISLQTFTHPWTGLFVVFYKFTNTLTFVTTITICILTGVLFALLAYRFDNAKRMSASKFKTMSSIAIFLGIAAPGCAACGVGLAVAIGLGSSLAKLPFRGAEVSILAIILLSYSVYKISRSFVSCEIDFKQRQQTLET